MIKSPGKLICCDSVYAGKYGVREAILINYFQFYISANIKIWLAGKKKASNTTFRDGRTYTFISKSDLEQYYPFFTESKLKTSLNNLVDAGVLVKGCYNKLKYDKTTWYAFTKEDEFFELPDEYIQKKHGHQLVKSVSDHNTSPNQCSAIPPDDTLDNIDQGNLGFVSEQTTDEVLLTNPSEVKHQSIRQKSPTIPSNTTINQNKEYTYLPADNNYDILNISIQPLPDDLEEGELDNEILTLLDKANNNNTGKVGSKSFSAASGSSHNVDAFCSIENEVKLRKIFIQFKHETGQELTYFEKWYDWVKGKQEKPNEIKHCSAWTKSYLKFVEKNADFAKANEHEENRIKQEKLARSRLNANPYNDMRK